MSLGKLILFGCSFTCLQVVGQEKTLSLAGKWEVKIDSMDAGVQQQWYMDHSAQHITLPGTLDDAGIGKPPALSYEKLQKEVLLKLTRKHAYIGAAWYACEIIIPESWKEKDIELFLERVLWHSRAWIDGKEMGLCESLSTPHRFDLGNLKPGKHRLVLRIDNRRQYEISYMDMAHAYTDGTQIIWNGVIGNMQLKARNRSYIRAVQAFPAVRENSVTINASLQNGLPSQESMTLLIQVFNKQKIKVADKEVECLLQPGENSREVKITMKSPTLWDEFSPALYKVHVQLRKKRSAIDSSDFSFGMREISHENGLLYINRRRLFLRGTLECNIFPLTGHPPMDGHGWLKVFATAKAYGLNHIRFHSWCPPEPAFAIADSLGMYIQVELPFWNKNAGKDEKINRFLGEEASRIIDAYGNHSSFCLWSMGNELEGDFNWLSKMVNELKKKDNRRLYTSTTFSFQQGHGKWPEPGDDFFITQYTKNGWVRGQGIFNTYPPDFKTDYTKAVEGSPVPLITHEIGQYSVYPDMKSIEKYTGVLDPLNFKAIKKDLQRKNLLHLSSAFTLASGKFSADLYKEEIERALKTKGMSGFQLLDLHDFPGQGTALVGILDAFWESKGLVTPEEHRMYCSPVVPLLRFEKATYVNNEQFSATAEIANFSAGALKDMIPVWTAKDQEGKVVASGRLNRQDIISGNVELGRIAFDLDKIQRATRLMIELRLEGTAYRNHWNVWVYPQQLKEHTGEVIFVNTLREAISWLDQGKTVLLNPDTAALLGVQGRFAPVFWSPVHFPDQPGTMGLLCDPRHPALQHFPTDFYCGWQWWDLITSSKAMIIDSLPTMEPVVRVIDNFFKNRKMANIIEANVGKGKLLLVSIDITHGLDKRPAARQLRYSLEEYMAGKSFSPVNRLEPEELKKLFK